MMIIVVLLAVLVIAIVFVGLRASKGGSGANGNSQHSTVAFENPIYDSKGKGSTGNYIDVEADAQYNDYNDDVDE